MASDRQLKRVCEISALALNLIRSPAPSTVSEQLPEMPASAFPWSAIATKEQLSPAGLASAMLGVSLVLMFCGSVTFFLGFLLMPWIVGLVVLLYVAGIVTTVFMLVRSLLRFALGPSSSPKHAAAEFKSM